MANTALKQLIDISHFYGQNPEYVIAGGGNTSFKDNENIWVKASGTSLSNIEEDGFVRLSREKLSVLKSKSYSENTTEREQQVKLDLNGAVIAPKNLRPSVETSMHEVIDYAYIIHTHPTYVNALMCSKNAEQLTYEIFGTDVVYIEYTDPGYILFKKVFERITEFKNEKGFTPKIIFLQNHGVFVGAHTTDEIKAIYADIEQKLSAKIKNNDLSAVVHSCDSPNLLAAKKYFADKSLIAEGYMGDLVKHFIKDVNSFALIEKPFTPDIIVYCKSNYLFVENGAGENDIHAKIDGFQQKHGYMPKVILFENNLLVIAEDSESNVRKVLDVFIDMMKISRLSENFGGPSYMTQQQIDFIDNWEVENYRRKVSKES